MDRLSYHAVPLERVRGHLQTGLLLQPEPSEPRPMDHWLVLLVAALAGALTGVLVILSVVFGLNPAA